MPISQVTGGQTSVATILLRLTSVLDRALKEIAKVKRGQSKFSLASFDVDPHNRSQYSCARVLIISWASGAGCSLSICRSELPLTDSFHQFVVHRYTPW